MPISDNFSLVMCDDVHHLKVVTPNYFRTTSTHLSKSSYPVSFPVLVRSHCNYYYYQEAKWKKNKTHKQQQQQQTVYSSKVKVLENLNVSSASQNLLAVVENKTGPDKAQHPQYLLRDSLVEYSPKHCFCQPFYHTGSLGAQGSLQSTLNIWCNKSTWLAKLPFIRSPMYLSKSKYREAIIKCKYYSSHRSVVCRVHLIYTVDPKFSHAI